MLPLLMTVLLAIISVHRRGTAMGLMGIVIAFGPAIGPTLSGFLLEHFHWRSLFCTVLPIVAVTLIVGALFIRNVTDLRKPRIDVLSIILSSFGFGSFLYGFSIAGEQGWSSPLVLSIIGVGIVIIGLFIWRQMTLKVPMLEFRVFQFPMFTLAIATTMTVLISLIGAETLLPLFMKNVLGFTPMESGLVLLPGAIVMGIMSPITGRLFDAFGAKWLALIGLTIVTVTTFLLSRLSLDTTFAYLSIFFAIGMAGLRHGSDAGDDVCAQPATTQVVLARFGDGQYTAANFSGNRYSYPGHPSIDGRPALCARCWYGTGLEAQLTGYTWAFLASTALAFVAFLIAWFLRPPKKEKVIVREIHAEAAKQARAAEAAKN